jgi:hypothetical protein
MALRADNCFNDGVREQGNEEREKKFAKQSPSLRGQNYLRKESKREDSEQRKNYAVAGFHLDSVMGRTLTRLLQDPGPRVLWNM